jgi:hypothetical protein
MGSASIGHHFPFLGGCAVGWFGRPDWRGRCGGGPHAWYVGQPAGGARSARRAIAHTRCWAWSRGFRCAIPPPPGRRGRRSPRHDAPARPALHPSAPGWEACRGVERHKHRIQARSGRLSTALAGRGNRPLADPLGLRAGMPSPWRVKALRSDGQVVPSSAAAALTLPSRSASWKARSASVRSERKRLGCQPSRRSGMGSSQQVKGGFEGVAVDAEPLGGLPQPHLARRWSSIPAVRPPGLRRRWPRQQRPSQLPDPNP